MHQVSLILVSIDFNIIVLFREMASKLILIYEDMRRHMVAAALEAETIIQELRVAQNRQ